MSEPRTCDVCMELEAKYRMTLTNLDGEVIASIECCGGCIREAGEEFQTRKQ